MSARSLPAVPVVDISNPSATSLAALDAACRDHGFFLLAGHGLDALIDHTWRETERFFDADRAVRQAVVRDKANPLGWFDRELTKRKRDQKEVFDFVDPAVPGLDRKNRWPNDLPGFRDSMVSFFDAFSVLAHRTLSLLHETLELSEEGRTRIGSDRRGSTVRLNHYPLADPVPNLEREDTARPRRDRARLPHRPRRADAAAAGRHRRAADTVRARRLDRRAAGAAAPWW